ncbi:hypothetical protein BDW69DRAFT_186922 [Aspergillus filifer]
MRLSLSILLPLLPPALGLLPTSPFSFPLMPSTLADLAHPLSCPQLTAVNTKLDSFIHYAFPSSIPPERAYAVASFAHGYKILLNNIHGQSTGCVSEDEMAALEMGLNKTSFMANVKNTQNQNQGIGTGMPSGTGLGKRQDLAEILCVIIDTLLGDNGGEAIPTGGGGGGGGGVSVSVTVSGMQPPALETGSSAVKIKRQDNDGDEGIVEVLLELVGTILQILLGCDLSDGGDAGGSGGDGGGAAAGGKNGLW